MIVYTDEDVRKHANFDQVCDAIRNAFISLDSGTSQLYDVVTNSGSNNRHFIAVKSGRDGSIPAIGLKAGSYIPENRAHGKPVHRSTILLIDDDTGKPLAVLEANYLNGLRTAAANTLATNILARENSTTLAVIGIGGQAYYDVLGIASIRKITRILAASRTGLRHSEFREKILGALGIEVEFVSAMEAVSEADIVTTLTPSTEPIVKTSWVRPGTHISAMGADAVGKQELEVELVKHNELFVDYPEQAVRIGETQHVARSVGISSTQLRDRTIGRLLRDKHPGRTDDSQITVFDSSGLAIQDIAAAFAVVNQAIANK